MQERLRKNVKIEQRRHCHACGGSSSQASCTSAVAVFAKYLAETVEQETRGASNPSSKSATMATRTILSFLSNDKRVRHDQIAKQMAFRYKFDVVNMLWDELKAAGLDKAYDPTGTSEKSTVLYAVVEKLGKVRAIKEAMDKPFRVLQPMSRQRRNNPFPSSY